MLKLAILVFVLFAACSVVRRHAVIDGKNCMCAENVSCDNKTQHCVCEGPAKEY